MSSDFEALADHDRRSEAGPPDPSSLGCADGWHVFTRGACDRCGDPVLDTIMEGGEYVFVVTGGHEWRGRVTQVRETSLLLRLDDGAETLITDDEVQEVCRR